MRALSIVACGVVLCICAAAAGVQDAFGGSCNACAQSGLCRNAGYDTSCATGNNVLRKLGRGCANVFMCPIEVYNQMENAHCAGGPLAALTWGLVKGTGMMGVRVLVGFYEIATFPFPVPAGYRPILTDPEFFLQDEAF